MTRRADPVVVAMLGSILAGCHSAPNTPRTPAVASFAFLDAAPPDALALDVHITSWSCSVTDPDGVFDEELHFPMKRAIRLNLHNDDRARDVDIQIEDKMVHVAHGSAEPLVFRVVRQGQYHWRCPVSKGPNVLKDVAVSIFAHPLGEYVEYQRWQDEQTRPKTREGRVRLGKQVYEKKGCSACHSDDGSPRVGSSFARLWGKRVTLADGRSRTVDEQFIKDSLLNPRVIRQPGYQDAMPSYEGFLRSEEISAVASYIESLVDQ